MKRLLTLILLLMGAITSYAQLSLYSTADQNLYEEICEDVQFAKYVWAVGYGDTIEEADNMALKSLSSIDLNIVTLHTGETVNDVSGGVARSRERDEEKFVGTAMMSLSNIHRIDLSNVQYQGYTYPYVILRYVTADEWSKRYDSLKKKIMDYLEGVEYQTSVVDQLRDYTWAYALLSQYNGEAIKVEGCNADQFVMSKIRELLNDIEVKVTGIEKDENNKHYPFKLFLDFMYEDEPLSDITFSYYDGGGQVDGESVKDGRGMVVMKRLPETFDITIDCFMENLARQRDPGIYQTILQLKNNGGALAGSVKKIVTEPKGVKPRKSVDTNATASVVAENLKQVEASYGKTTLATDAEVYGKIMSEIVASFQNISGDDVRHHFTDKAWKEYDKIVKEGNPVVARTPAWKFVKFDSLVICRELPLKLKFPSSRKAFIEDVVFRFNERTKKVESVAYKLSSNTEKCIMAKDWPERDRLTLITFLEDYRSAYCLRDIAYIKKVFSDDAYIITGKVLQKSKVKYNDQQELKEGDRVIYTRQSKQEYVENLGRSFRSKEFVNVRFEECDVCSGFAAKQGIYAVQVRQLYTSNNYADEGILTLAIDMREEVNPLVRVRVWQQERDVNYTAEQMMDRTVSTAGSFAGKSVGE